MGYAVRLSGRPEAAEDLVQEVLTRMGAAWWRIGGRDNLEAYAHVSLARLHIDTWRASEREALGPPPEVASVTSRDLDLSVDLQTALARLAPRQRAVLVMRYYLDWSEAQIAAALHCSRGTVKSQASDGLRRLRDAGLSPVSKGHHE
jgi:RNA polymerase sigma factor (sigma-70 family)